MHSGPDKTVFLCGFMGSGKSSLAKTLAKALEREYLDLDEYIEQAEKKSITALFESLGETTFRELEQRHLLNLLEDPSAKIVALGGGTVCFFDNLVRIKKKGLLVYLKLPAAALVQRLSASPQERPLLKGLSAADLKSRVENLLEQRRSYYEQAHLVVDVLHSKPETILNALRQLL